MIGKTQAKLKTSVTLSADVVKGITLAAGGEGHRSALIEQVLKEFLARNAREARDRQDLAILNAKAKRLNEEAEDVLAFQDTLL